MKLKLCALALLLMQAAPASARLSESRFGVGVIIGEPTGITAKHWTDSVAAIDGAVSWTRSALTVQIGLLLHNYGEFDIPEGYIGYYYGAGTQLRAAESENTRLGVRGVVGLSYLFDNTPVEIFMELGPVLYVVPDMEIEMTGGVGIRYYFF